MFRSFGMRLRCTIDCSLIKPERRTRRLLRDRAESHLAGSFQPQMPVDDLTIAYSEDRNPESKLGDRGHHAVDSMIIPPCTGRIGLEFRERAELDGWFRQSTSWPGRKAR